MGWASGSALADDLWETVKKLVPKSKQKKLAKKWVEVFENHDCDTMYETVVGDLAGLNDKDEED